MIGLEGSARGAPVTQPDQIRAHLLFAQFVRRPLVMGRQPANRLDVNVLAPGCQPRQGHVLDHPASQWRHRSSPFAPRSAGAHRPNRAKRYSQLFKSAMPRLTLGEAVSPIQGISSILASVARILGRNCHNNQSLTRKFPTQRNRELIGPYQGIKSAYQGNFLPDQGRVPWSGFPARSRSSSRNVGHMHTLLARRTATAMETVLARRDQPARSAARCPMSRTSPAISSIMA
jgi:hypothetical protein